MTDQERQDPDVSQERVTTVIGDEVAIERSAVRFVESKEVTTDRTAIGALNTHSGMFRRSAVGRASIERGSLTRSAAGLVVGRSIACDEVRTLVVAAPVVRGEVRALFDLRAFVALGVGIALGRTLLAGIRWGARAVMR